MDIADVMLMRGLNLSVLLLAFSGLGIGTAAAATYPDAKAQVSASSAHLVALWSRTLCAPTGRWTVAACSGACRTAAAEPRTVSTARGIDPDYLRIRGERVYWRQRTVVRSASIAP
jgi:hypothetical protein